MNKSVTKYIFPYSSFHAEHDGCIYFHVQQLLRKLEGLLQQHVSLFIPPPYPVLSQYIPFYEVRRNIKKAYNAYNCSKCVQSVGQKRTNCRPKANSMQPCLMPHDNYQTLQ